MLHYVCKLREIKTSQVKVNVNDNLLLLINRRIDLGQTQEAL